MVIVSAKPQRGCYCLRKQMRLLAEKSTVSKNAALQLIQVILKASECMYITMTLFKKHIRAIIFTPIKTTRLGMI